MKLHHFILSILFLFFVHSLFGQQKQFDFRKDFTYSISETSEEMIIDGKLSEDTWQNAEVGGDFWQKIPFYAPDAKPKTEFMISYDNDNLYIAARCYQTEDVIITSLKRDEYWDNDGIAVVLDPLNSFTNTTMFGTSAIGVQYDAVRTETSGLSNDWSNKWYVETQITDEYWTAEFAIPFKILRYDQKQTEWGLNFVRNVKYLNQNHNWTAVPESFWPPDAAFTGALVWPTAPSKKSGNYNLIPYVTTSVSKQTKEDTKVDYDMGLDAKVALSSALNLDLTLHPDFSQIEVDELVTNLTRFNIGLPEKRTFFLENADLFADFGTGGARPFFSRKIGLDQNLRAVPILYGARLTGNLNKDTRIGLMNIHSRSTDDALGQNQTAISVKRQIGRSFIQGLFLNRQAFDGSESLADDYGRNASLEAAYLSDDGKLAFWGGAHQSFKKDISGNTGMYNLGIEYTDPTWEILFDNFMFQENYFADLGFTARVQNYDAVRDIVIRVGYNRSYARVDYRIRPKEGNVQSHRFGFENLLVYNPDWTFNEQYNRLRYFLALKSNQEIQIRLNYGDLDLLFPFSFTGEEPLPAKRYRTVDLNLGFESDDRKAFSYDLSAQTGGFYNGRLTKFEINANYRIQPWGNFGMGYQWNDISFPDPYGSTKITALVSKVEIGFSRNLLWTTLFQYVDQSDFVGINSRLQWRFSPMSDIFLVYVDNYDISDALIGGPSISSNNRALILKASYWY